MIATTPLATDHRAFAHRMFGRLLAIWPVCDFIALLNTQTGEAGGTKLASWPSTEKATSAILPKQGSHRLVGRGTRRKARLAWSILHRHHSYSRILFPSPAAGCHDVALSRMQSQQHTKDDLLSLLSCSLECGMYSTATLQIQEQQEVQEGDFGAQGGRAGQSRSGYMGGISRQAAMDIHYAGQQGQLQSGIRNFYGETAWNASASQFCHQLHQSKNQWGLQQTRRKCCSI